MSLMVENNIREVNKDWNKNDKLEDVLEKQVFVVMSIIQVVIPSHLVHVSTGLKNKIRDASIIIRHMREMNIL